MNIRHATRMLFRHRTLSPQTCRMISVKTTPPRETSANSFGHHSLADNSGRLAANLEEVRGELLERNIDSSSLANRLEHELFNEYYDKADQTVDLLIETCRKNNETEDLARLYFMKGMISKGKGQESKGTPFLLRALTLSGDKLMETLEPTMLLLGFEMITEYYLSQSNYSSALEWQDSVIHIAQRHNLINHRHFDQRSFILARLGKYGEAIDDLKRSIDIQFDLFGRVNKESQNDLALLKCRHAMGRKLYRKALISLENYLNSNANLQTVDYELIVTKVEIMEKLGMVNGAVTYLWQVQKSLDADHLTKLAPLIQFKIAELQMSIGRYDEALDTLELLSTEYVVSKDMTGQIEELHFIVSETKKQHHAKRASHKGAYRTTAQQTANVNKRPK